jgi:hypothetical protein
MTTLTRPCTRRSLVRRLPGRSTAAAGRSVWSCTARLSDPSGRCPGRRRPSRWSRRCRRLDRQSVWILGRQPLAGLSRQYPPGERQEVGLRVVLPAVEQQPLRADGAIGVRRPQEVQAGPPIDRLAPKEAGDRVEEEKLVGANLRISRSVAAPPSPDRSGACSTSRTPHPRRRHSGTRLRPARPRGWWAA